MKPPFGISLDAVIDRVRFTRRPVSRSRPCPAHPTETGCVPETDAGRRRQCGSPESRNQSPSTLERLLESPGDMTLWNQGYCPVDRHNQPTVIYFYFSTSNMETVALVA